MHPDPVLLQAVLRQQGAFVKFKAGERAARQRGGAAHGKSGVTGHLIEIQRGEQRYLV